jgi:hypothetical protein
MGVSLTDFAPKRCERGHYLGLHGRRLVSWLPCACPPAVERQPRGSGHIYVRCTACQDQGREVIYYDPKHEPAR